MKLTYNNYEYKIKNSKIITTVGGLKKLARKMDSLKEFAFDTETNTLRVFGANSNFKMVGISFSWGAYHNYYIPTGHYFDEDNLDVRLVAKYLRPIFAKKDIRVIGQNLN